MILQTAGFDSVPGEMILQYAKQSFPGKLNTLETYVTFNEGEHGAAVNTGEKNRISGNSRKATRFEQVQVFSSSDRSTLSENSIPGTFNSIIEICRNIRKMPAIREQAWGSVFAQPWQKVEYRNRLT